MPVTVIGDEALAAKFNAAAATLQAEKAYWLHDVGIILEEAIEANIARQGLIDTGDLIDSGRVFNQTANGVSVGFGNMLGYAEPLELGSREHWIEAGAGWWSSATMLSFYNAKRGEWFYGPRVWHPGNRPYRFMYHGALESVVPIAFYFMERLRAIFGGL